MDAEAKRGLFQAITHGLAPKVLTNKCKKEQGLGMQRGQPHGTEPETPTNTLDTAAINGGRSNS